MGRDLDPMKSSLAYVPAYYKFQRLLYLLLNIFDCLRENTFALAFDNQRPDKSHSSRDWLLVFDDYKLFETHRCTVAHINRYTT